YAQRRRGGAEWDPGGAQRDLLAPHPDPPPRGGRDGWGWAAIRPVAVGVGEAERGAPMSQSAYSRVRGAATAKGVAQRGCSATGPTPRATGSPAALGYAGAGPPLLRSSHP